MTMLRDMLFDGRRTRRTAPLVSLLLALCTATSGLAQQSPVATLESLGTLAEAVDTVEVANGHLLTSAGRTITLFDIANPAALARRGAYTFPEEVWSFSVVGTLAYVGANFFGLGILDVSNPAAPKLLGSFKTPGQAKAAAVAAGKAAVIDHMEGLVFVDVSNPSKPTGLGTFFVDGYGRDVVSVGAHVYAVDSPSGLYALDLSKPTPLEPVGSVQSGVNLRMLDVTRQKVAGRPDVAVLSGGGMLQIYDITAPGAPSKLTSFKLPGQGLRLTVAGNRVYVADGPTGVQVIDISKPSTPTIVASFKTAMPARDIAVGAGLVFVATTDSVIVLKDLP